MRSRLILAAAMLLLPPPVAAPAQAQQTPAERASRSLDREVARDRFRDAAESARGADRAPSVGAPLPTASARDLEADRATNQPDVGRPEQRGWLPETQRSTGEDRNVNR
jgi:hypothetical protein